MNRFGRGRVTAFSAGSYPRPAPDPMVLEELAPELSDFWSSE